MIYSEKKKQICYTKLMVATYCVVVIGELGSKTLVTTTSSINPFSQIKNILRGTCFMFATLHWFIVNNAMNHHTADRHDKYSFYIFSDDVGTLGIGKTNTLHCHIQIFSCSAIQYGCFLFLVKWITFLALLMRLFFFFAGRYFLDFLCLLIIKFFCLHNFLLTKIYEHSG
ncbi:hypothetical protein ACJX0J_026806 [Zea mays]